MPYWVCYYHIVWATKERLPLITPQNEKMLLKVIEQQSIKLKCPVVALNAVADHIHVAVCIAPSLAVANWVSKVKGFSSHVMTEAYPDTPFHWQEGYGVLTFGTKNLPFVKKYIENQKERHRKQELYSQLEQTEE